MVYYEDSLIEPGRRIVQRIENFCPFHAGFDALLRQGDLIAWAGALLGGEAVLFKDKINFKLPGGGGFAAHQDQQAGWSIHPRQWLPRDCRGPAQGGAHRRGVAPVGRRWAGL
jgi:hypothetical protein